MKNESVIIGIGTAVPKRQLVQRELGKSIVRAIPPEKTPLVQLTRRLYQSGGIDTRHTVLADFPAPGPYGMFVPDAPRSHAGPTTGKRNRLYATYAPALALDAARAALSTCREPDPKLITHLITVSCTGFATPGIDCALIQTLGLRPDIARTHIGFMGCFAALPALRTADEICRASPFERVLVVCVELCSVHYQHWLDPEIIIANSLFADGAAAAIVAPHSARRDGTHIIRSFSSRIIPGSRSAMSWTIGNHGFTMTLGKSVPDLIGSAISETVIKTCADAKIAPGDIERFAIHPGGKAIMDTIEKRLALGPDALDCPRSVLRSYGNMSSPTLLFVLDMFYKRGLKGVTFLAGFGPGLAAETAILEAL